MLSTISLSCAFNLIKCFTVYDVQGLYICGIKFQQNFNYAACKNFPAVHVTNQPPIILITTHNFNNFNNINHIILITEKHTHLIRFSEFFDFIRYKCLHILFHVNIIKCCLKRGRGWAKMKQDAVTGFDYSHLHPDVQTALPLPVRTR